MSESGPPFRRTRSWRPSLHTTQTDFKVYNASKRGGEIFDVVGSGEARTALGVRSTESRQPARGAPVSPAFLGAPSRVNLSGDTISCWCDLRGSADVGAGHLGSPDQ
jgi:hypothetical protein